MINSSIVHKGWSWDRLKSRVWNSTQVFHVHVWSPSAWIIFSVFSVALSGSWSETEHPGTWIGTSIWKASVASGDLTVPQCWSPTLYSYCSVSWQSMVMSDYGYLPSNFPPNHSPFYFQRMSLKIKIFSNCIPLLLVTSYLQFVFQELENQFNVKNINYFGSWKYYKDSLWTQPMNTLKKQWTDNIFTVGISLAM